MPYICQLNKKNKQSIQIARWMIAMVSGLHELSDNKNEYEKNNFTACWVIVIIIQQRL